MTTLEIIQTVAALRDGDARLPRLAAVLDGTAGAGDAEGERWLSLSEVAGRVGRSPSRLHRLGVPAACGIRLGGNRSYRVGDVLNYLTSAACAARVRELAEARQKKEGSK